MSSQPQGATSVITPLSFQGVEVAKLVVPAAGGNNNVLWTATGTAVIALQASTGDWERATCQFPVPADDSGAAIIFTNHNLSSAADASPTSWDTPPPTSQSGPVGFAIDWCQAEVVQADDGWQLQFSCLAGVRGASATLDRIGYQVTVFQSLA